MLPNLFKFSTAATEHGCKHEDQATETFENPMKNKYIGYRTIECGVNPDDLIDKLDKSLTDLKRFDNVQHVFLCKIPARFDSHNINSKVSRFNELLVERYLDTEDWITVIDTIPPEIRYYYHDGLHMSHLGVTKLCSIVMSNLYKIIAPMSYRKRSHSKSNRRASRR